MRALPLVLTAALALSASPAFAKPMAKPAAKPAAAKPAPKPAVKPMPPMAAPAGAETPECCKPGAAPHPHGEAAMGDCCAPGAKPHEHPGKPMAGHHGEMGKPGPHGDMKPGHHGDMKPGACCAEGGACDGSCQADKGPKAMDCCEDGTGECCAPDAPKPPHGMMDKPHGMMGKPGPRTWVVARRHAMVKGHELRYMPAGGTSANQHLIYGGDRRWQMNEIFSLGGQMNWAVQLSPTAANQGNWLTPYGGVLPRAGVALGPVRLDVGVLGGFGTMLRTGTVGTATDALQARLMWVVEPRVELGWQGEHMGAGLVGAYNLNPNMNEFGGPSVGLRFTWKKGGWM